MESNVERAEIIEKELICDFFKDKKSGFFIEVGANEPDPVYSQTFHLEKNYNWTGILIEPIDYLFDKLKSARTGAKAFQVACTSKEKTGIATLKIPVSGDHEITGHACLEVNVDHSLLYETRDVEVNAVTLNSILLGENISKVDFLSIDVEGTELDVLKGFDLLKYSPELIIIEDRMVFLSKHLYLKKHGYQIFRRTGFNNWYGKTNEIPFVSFTTKLNLFRKIYLSSWIKKTREAFRMKTIKTFTQL